MNHRDPSHGMPLPTTVIDRIVFAVVCLLLFAVSVFAGVALITNPPQPQSIAGWLFLCVIEALFVGLFAFSGSGVLWCVTQAKFAEQLLVKGVLRLLIPLALFCLISLPIVLWAMFRS